MKKGIVFAAVMSALAMSAAGSASAAPAGALATGLTADKGAVEQVHYRKYRHYHGPRYGKKRWHKGRKHRHCFIRVGRRVCVWR